MVCLGNECDVLELPSLGTPFREPIIPNELSCIFRWIINTKSNMIRRIIEKRAIERVFSLEGKITTPTRTKCKVPKLGKQNIIKLPLGKQDICVGISLLSVVQNFTKY